MQTDTQKHNETVTPNSKEIGILKKYFPQCFSVENTVNDSFDKKDCHTDSILLTQNQGKESFDIEKFKELIAQNDIEIKKEGFTLNFLGKSYARYQANLDSETVIVPDAKNDNESNKDSENVYIVGDNLDALQHLRHSYAEQIKCIYIDPPYNTGKDDFVYNDKFGFTAKELVEKLDITEEEAERIVGMGGKCTHSAWLTFMYPRLALARELLRDDGVIFISIDDNEQANLKRLCDEVFGEGNFVAQLIWESKYTVSNDSQYISSQHEYVLFYAKQIDSFTIGRLERTEEQNASYKNRDNDPKGAWKPTPLHAKSGTEKSKYDITFSNGITWKCPQGRFPRYSKETLLKLYEQNELYFNKNGGVDKKTYLSEVSEKGIVPGSILKYSEVGHTHENNEELASFVGKGIFDNPKGTRLLSRIMNLANLQPTDIVLDFFSGSGTTAHAVMKQNIENDTNYKFIMVQIPAECSTDKESFKAGYKTIDEIGRERIRRAAAKLKAEHPDTKADLGFKTYYLKPMPQNTIDKIKKFDPNELTLISSDGDIIKTLGESSLLQTWQIKDGFGFYAKAQKIDILGYTAYLLDSEKIGKYLYLLDGMEDKAIKELIRKIESIELVIDKIFVYGYSFDFNALTSLKTNLKTLKNRNPIEPIVRY